MAGVSGKGTVFFEKAEVAPLIPRPALFKGTDGRISGVPALDMLEREEEEERWCE
jgi:hypothetical protein